MKRKLSTGHVILDPEEYILIRAMWPIYSIACISREIGVSFHKVCSIGKDLCLERVPYKKRFEPARQEWIRIATEEALRLSVSPVSLMAGSRHRRVVVARWRAWERVMAENPHISIAGLGRMSGFDHSSCRHGLLRIKHIWPRTDRIYSWKPKRITPHVQGPALPA